MIVVDSSVWIAQLRRSRTPAVEKLEALPTDEIIVGDLVLLEVLQGARDDRHAMEVERELRNLTIGRMLDDRVAVSAARNYRALRRRGTTIYKTPDLIIATCCIEYDHALLHDDRDFDSFVTHLGLRVI